MADTAPPAPARSRGIRLSDRILIAGQTGKGKTELAKFIVAGEQPCRTICVDPKEEHTFHDPKSGEAIVPARTPLELARAMHGAVVHYVPAGFDREQLEECFQIIHETPGPLIVWVDEASEISSPGWCPEGLRLDVTQGRRHRKQVLAVTQRLHEIHPVFRSQSEHIFLMVPAPIMLDLKALSGNVGARRTGSTMSSGAAPASGDYSHLWYCRDTDEMRRCAPIPLSPPAAGRGRPLPNPTSMLSTLMHARRRLGTRVLREDRAHGDGVHHPRQVARDEDQRSRPELGIQAA